MEAAQALSIEDVVRELRETQRMVQQLLPYVSSATNSTRDMTTEEFGQAIRAKPETVCGYINAGRIEGAYKAMDGTWRIPREAVEKCKKGKHKTKTETATKAAQVLAMHGISRR